MFMLIAVELRCGSFNIKAELECGLNSKSGPIQIRGIFSHSVSEILKVGKTSIDNFVGLS